MNFARITTASTRIGNTATAEGSAKHVIISCLCIFSVATTARLWLVIGAEGTVSEFKFATNWNKASSFNACRIEYVFYFLAVHIIFLHRQGQTLNKVFRGSCGWQSQPSSHTCHDEAMISLQAVVTFWDAKIYTQTCAALAFSASFISKANPSVVNLESRNSLMLEILSPSKWKM